jgi:nucleoid-associated protein YgaU
MSDIIESALILLESTSSKAKTVALIDFPGILVSSNYESFEVIERPQRVGFVNWKGHQPLTMTIPLLFEGRVFSDSKHREGRSIEDLIQGLEALAGRGPGQGGQPPVLKITVKGGYGSLVPHNFNGENVPWVINSIEWGDNIRRASSGHRVRQQAVIEVIQYVKVKSPADLSVSKRNRIGNRNVKAYTVKKGDTLISISHRVYGTADRWPEIGKLNGITDPRKVYPKANKAKTHLYIGQTLKMP